MSEITDAERAAWQAACQWASPGPWITTWDNQELQLHPVDDPSAIIAEWGYAVSPWRPETYEDIDRADIDFIIAARTALPRLLAALTQAEGERVALGESARVQVAALRAELEEARHDAEYAVACNAALRVQLATCAAERDAAQKEIARSRAGWQESNDIWSIRRRMEDNRAILVDTYTVQQLLQDRDTLWTAYEDARSALERCQTARTQAALRQQDAATQPPPLCGIMSASGPNREMLACAYEPGHKGAHSWATLPTFGPDGEIAPSEELRRLRRIVGAMLEHLPTCHRVNGPYALENDCSCGLYERREYIEDLAHPSQATQPPLPDPAAPQQLGLGGYASDHGKGW